MNPKTAQFIGMAGIAFMIIGIGTVAVYVNKKMQEDKK